MPVPEWTTTCVNYVQSGKANGKQSSAFLARHQAFVFQLSEVVHFLRPVVQVAPEQQFDRFRNCKHELWCERNGEFLLQTSNLHFFCNELLCGLLC